MKPLIRDTLLDNLDTITLKITDSFQGPDVSLIEVLLYITFELPHNFQGPDVSFIERFHIILFYNYFSRPAGS